MTFWHYLSEFFLFRWLFGSHKHKETTHPTSDPHWEDRDLSHIPSHRYANFQDDPDEDDDLDDYSDLDNYSSMYDYDTIDNYDDIDDDF